MLDHNGIDVNLGLGLASHSFPFFLCLAHFGSAYWALNEQPVGAFNVQPVGLHSDRYMQHFSPHIS